MRSEAGLFHSTYPQAATALRRMWQSAVVVSCLFVAACGGASIEPGTLEGETFKPMADGDSLPVVLGLQTGMWSMPAVRCEGCAEGGVMTASVDLDNGDHAGSVSLAVRLRSGEDDDVYMLDYIAIPIAHEANGPPLESLYDNPARLELTFTSSEIEGTIKSVTRIQLARGAPVAP